MGMIADSFGWMFNIQKKSLDEIDVKQLEEKLRATKRVSDIWENDIKKCEAEYREAVSVEANASRSPIARKLALQRGAIVAKRLKTLTSAVNMMNKLAGVVDQLKMLKKFYTDMKGAMQLPKGLSVEEVMRQIYQMSDSVSSDNGQLDEMMAQLDRTNQAMNEDAGNDEIEKLMNELNELYDEYNTMLATNDTEAVETVKAKIELKKAEVDKQMGISVLA